MKIKKALAAALCAVGMAAGVAAPAQADYYSRTQTAWGRVTYDCLHYVGCHDITLSSVYNGLYCGHYYFYYYTKYAVRYYDTLVCD